MTDRDKDFLGHIGKGLVIIVLCAFLVKYLMTYTWESQTWGWILTMLIIGVMYFWGWCAGFTHKGNHWPTVSEFKQQLLNEALTCKTESDVLAKFGEPDFTLTQRHFFHHPEPELGWPKTAWIEKRLVLKFAFKPKDSVLIGFDIDRYGEVLNITFT